MKPFNLEKCIAGEKVVTRDGSKVEMPTYNKNADKDCRLACWVDGELISFTDEGKFLDNGEDSDYDLFMAEPILYYAIYMIGDSYHTTKMYTSKEDLLFDTKNLNIEIRTFELK